MIHDVCFAASLGFVVLLTAAWILQVVVLATSHEGKVSAAQNIAMSLAWAVFFFLWLQK